MNKSVIVVEIRIGRGNRRTRRKTVPLQFNAPQIPHDLICVRNGVAELGSQRFIARSLTGFCKNGNERSGSVKGGKCFDKLSHSQLLKKGCVV
jgi:hypothetical protein